MNDNVLIKARSPDWVASWCLGGFRSSTANTPDSIAWINSSRRWLKDFCKRIGAELVDFNRGHFYWSAFIKIGDQYWYLRSGDVRFQVCDWMLVRTADGPKDYTGGINKQVNYRSTRFEADLIAILNRGKRDDFLNY